MKTPMRKVSVYKINGGMHDWRFIIEDQPEGTANSLFFYFFCTAFGCSHCVMIDVFVNFCILLSSFSFVSYYVNSPDVHCFISSFSRPQCSLCQLEPLVSCPGVPCCFVSLLACLPGFVQTVSHHP